MYTSQYEHSNKKTNKKIVHVLVTVYLFVTLKAEAYWSVISSFRFLFCFVDVSFLFRSFTVSSFCSFFVL